MTTYHSKPATIEAWPYDGTAEARYELLAILKANGRSDVVSDGGHVALMINTNNGWVELKPGHFLMKGVSDFYPCDPVTFEARWTDQKPSGRDSLSEMDRRNLDAANRLKDWFYNHPERVSDLITPESALGDDYCAVTLAVEALKRAEVLRPSILLYLNQPGGLWQWGVHVDKSAPETGEDARRDFEAKEDALEWLGRNFPGVEIKVEGEES